MLRSALIPAAGRGARLDRPGTPKPLVDVAGEALIVRLLRQLERAGIVRAVVVVGYRGEQIGRVLTDVSDLRLGIEIVENPTWQDGLAGSVARARGRFSDPFVLAMADHVFDEGLVRLMAEQEAPPDGASMLVDPRLGSFELESDVTVRLDGARVVDIGRRLSAPDGIDAGLFVATPALFDALDESMRAGSPELCDAVRLLARKNDVRAVPVGEAAWNDVDRPADLVRAEMRLRGLRRARPATPDRMFTAPEGRQFELVTSARSTTRIVVGRGFVGRPSLVDLVPEESSGSPIFVFTDGTVNRLYGATFVEKLRSQSYEVHPIVLPDGEEAKTLSSYSHLVERVLSRGVDERSVFISLGGGVVCNVCGFVASTIYRGLELVHVPTTLMAQCDAAISHKQAINGHRGKNMVGTYYPPRLVAVDVDVLSTLPKRLVRDGLAEAAKHAIAQDPAYVQMLLSHRGDIADLDFLEDVVRRNVELKRLLVLEDPKEHREGVALQYGHTFGHPLEHLSGYRLYHGESVAVGMMIASRVARLLGACGDDSVDVHRALLRHIGLPTEAPASIGTNDVLASLRYNKRYLTEGTRMSLLSAVGEIWSVAGEHMIPVSDQVLSEAFEASRGRDDSWLNGSSSSPVRALG